MDPIGPGRRVLLGVLLGVLLLSPVPASGTVDVPTPSPATIGECLGHGEIWLHVRTDAGEVLRSECVGTPTTGLEALAAADVATTEAKGGYLCTLAGYPDRCPGRFTGQYWQYWHAASDAAPWAYSPKGAGEHRPAPGSIEGWCYNASGEKRCRLPVLAETDGPAERVDLEPVRGGIGLWAAGIVAVMLVFVVVQLRRRRTSTAPE
ncbi:hypothetical protein KVF89_25390 [Nocardioides carbamazepini]|uniref:hypothetical protein n=1 Tax=Nocardioides carbamazepini TaxID=2854259 RepID=UPI00214A8067|nr:hypothetical protein [Nocardioides carbamazepini]MCR1785894.1 hypothetical protein [Nocardioides carbamazepini]